MDNRKDARSIFLAAVEKSSPEDRAAYLQEACGEDAELRQRVEALLQAHDDPDSVLDRPVVESDFDLYEATQLSPTVQEEAGSVIGPYKLLQELGRGGMGVVFMAEQTEPVRRKVALKIIKPGMDSQQVIARLEAERQALAMMEHQNIAHVFDAGTTDTGRPYFVMELVKGVPITEYCDRNRLTPRERLELFIPICQALQHAHQKGIIHRDIKPTNVLVSLYDGNPVPKVIDFGVAKAIEQRLTEKTMFTQYGQIVGTLEYMSPEQAEMNQLDVDTRSDIYSLGVLIYELLTGSTPITREQLHEAGFAEILRLIRELEPEKPSTRLSNSRETLPTISAQRKSEPAKLGALLRGELDWIVMKALEKDRTRRYDTAGDFAKDIQRHLDDEPVEACPPSTWYRLSKLARRHRAAIGSATTILLILVAATIFSTTQFMKARVARKEAVDNLHGMEEMAQVAGRERDRAIEAEQDARDQLQEARRQTQRAEKAEGEAKTDRDRAVAAEKRAQNEAAKNARLRERSQDALASALFDQARALRVSDQPGRRWRTLDLLKQAEELRSRPRTDIRLPEEESAKKPPVRLPQQAELRSEAVAALLQPDGRIAIREKKTDDLAPHAELMQWDGNINAVSPDGRFVATTSVNVEKGETGLSVVEIETGKEIWSPDQKNLGKDFPLVMAVSPGGKQLAWFSIMHPGNLKIRNLETNDEPRMLKVPGSSLMDAIREKAESVLPVDKQPPVDGKAKSLDDLPEPKLSKSEKQQAYRDIARKAAREGAEDYQKQKSAKDKSVQSANQIAGAAFKFRVGGLFFSPDGRWLFGLRNPGGAQSEVLLWDLHDGATDSGRAIATVDLRPQLRPAFSPNGRLLAWPDKEGTVILWNLEENKQEAQLELPLYLDGLLAFTPDGNQLVTHGHHPDDVNTNPPKHPGRLLVWDIPGNRVVRDFETSRMFLATAVSVSPDGRRIAVGQMNGELLVIDKEGGSTLRLDHGAMPVSLQWTPGGRIVSTGIGACKVWELSTETPLTTHTLNTEQRDWPITRLALSPDAQQVAVEATRASGIDLFDLKTGNRIRTFEMKRRAGLPGSWLEFTPDGKRLVRSAFDGFRIWDVAGDGQPRMIDEKEVFKGSMVTSFGFGHDGALFLAGFDGSHPAVKDALTGKLIWKRDDQQLRAWPRMSRDGSLVAFHSEKEPGRGPRMIEVCRLPGGEVVHQFPSSRKGFNFQTAVDFSSDNRWLIEIELAMNLQAWWAGSNPLNPIPMMNVSGSTDESWKATLWNLETGEKHWEIEGEVKSESMAFSPDGRYFAVSQRDGRLLLWDLDGRQRLLNWQAWEGTPEFVLSTRQVVFTSDGDRIAVAAESGSAIRMLDLKRLNGELNEIGLGW